MILNIHLERIDDNGERLIRILDTKKAVVISVVPLLLTPNHEAFRSGIHPPDYYYPEKVVGILKKHPKNANIYFGQQGYLHYCLDCLKRKVERDPWHENKCLYGNEKTPEEQKKILQKGKKIIESTLGISPVAYVPPNHQFDDSTKIAAAELGYKYFVVRNLNNINPYKEKNLIILPESKLNEEQEGEIVYAHYDEMKDNFNKYLELIEKSKPLEKIRISEQTSEKIVENEEKIIKRKKERDAKKQKPL